MKRTSLILLTTLFIALFIPLHVLEIAKAFLRGSHCAD
jgi:hypothetical protein